LLSTDEILNLDVIQMAMKEQSARKNKHKAKKVLQELDPQEQADPAIYVEE